MYHTDDAFPHLHTFQDFVTISKKSQVTPHFPGLFVPASGRKRARAATLSAISAPSIRPLAAACSSPSPTCIIYKSCIAYCPRRWRLLGALVLALLIIGIECIPIPLYNRHLPQIASLAALRYARRKLEEPRRISIMLLAKITTAIAATASFVQALTPPTQENPLLQWVAQLPDSKSTTGSVLIGQGPGGNGVSVQASFAGLPTEGGPFRASTRMRGECCRMGLT